MIERRIDTNNNEETKSDLSRLIADAAIATAAIQFPAISIIGPLADFALNKKFRSQKLERLENLLKILGGRHAC